MVVGDTMGPLPKGVGHIMQMTLLTAEFGYLDLTRKSILFLLPSSREVSFIRVTTTLATSTSLTPMPPARGPFRDGGISGHLIITGGVVVVGVGLFSR